MPPAFSLRFDNHSFSSETHLLTPPLSSHGSNRPPFKPLDSDHVSLSMKGSGKILKHRRCRLNRACVSSGELNDTYFSSSDQSQRTTSSKSWPDISHYFGRARSELQAASTPGHIKQQPLLSAQDSTVSHTPSTISTQRNPWPHRHRRWTVPSKASPTRFLCSVEPPGPLGTLTKWGEATATDTPAMIVLRRASIQKPVLEPAKDSMSEITFFPRPQVTKTSTSLFGFLRLTQMDGDESHKNSVDTTATLLRRPSTSPSPPRKPSMAGNIPLPCASEVAQPAFTALVMDSAGVMHPRRHPRTTLDIPQTVVGRRSSTTITTGNSVHEIIWDENVTSSSGSNTASQSSRRSTGKSVKNYGDIRHSVAVETLEMQLQKDTQARRESDASGHSTTQPHGSPSLRDQKSFQHLVDFQFGTATPMPTKPRSLHSTAPASRLRASTLHDEEQHVGPMTIKEDDDEPVGHVDYFPPLRSRAGSGAPQDRHKSVALGSSRHVPDQRKFSTGSALGRSSHVRRRSAAVSRGGR